MYAPSYYPVKIGSHVSIGSNSIVEAATIGDGVRIGSDCIIGKFAVIKDGAHILDRSVVAAGTVIPSMAVFAGSPAVHIHDLPESSPELMEAETRQMYAEAMAEARFKSK